METMKERDKKMAAKLNEEHRIRADRINRNRLEPPPLAENSKVWYRPERQPGTDKLAPEWRGPATVIQRVGPHSYIVELTPGQRQEAHRSQLHPHVLDLYSSKPFPMHYFHGKAPEINLAPDEYIPEKFLDFRKKGDGSQEVLVKWLGFTTDPTWEPVSAFFSPEFRDFCKKRRLDLRLV